MQLDIIIYILGNYERDPQFLYALEVEQIFRSHNDEIIKI